MTDNSTKANFVTDTDKTSEMEDLYALNQVKKAISKKKREIKDKTFLEEHPKLTDIVQAHRRRKIQMEAPVEGEKIPLKVTHPKVDVKLEEPPKQVNVKQEVDLDKLADKVVEKMSKKEISPVIVDAPQVSESPKSAEKSFNDTIAQAPKKPPPVKTTIAVGGKWF